MLARAPGVKRIPILKFLVLADIVRLAHNHANKLTPNERKRVLELVKEARGLTTNLNENEREELKALVLKAEPRLFAGESANLLSPIPIPRRIRQGKRKPATATGDKP